MGETEFYLLREKGDTRMLGKERGTVSGSDLYFQTPSEMARRMLYYMTSCGYYYTDYDYRIEREDYHNYMVFYICDGRLSLTSGGRTMVASAGQAGMLNCHKPHEYHAIGNAEFVWLHLDGVNTGQFYEQIVQQKKDLSLIRSTPGRSRTGSMSWSLPAGTTSCPGRSACRTSWAAC